MPKKVLHRRVPGGRLGPAGVPVICEKEGVEPENVTMSDARVTCSACLKKMCER